MTRKPLLDLIPDILKHIQKHQETLQYNLRLYRVAEGQIRKEIEDSMREEILSPSALRRALKRLPSLNILKKVVDKLSKVYAEPVARITKNKVDQSIMDTICKVSNLDSVMMAANRMLNLTKMAAIEPFVKNGKQQFRVLAGHQFLPFSDDLVDPMNMTVFIKLVGSTIKMKDDYRPYIHTDGILVTEGDEIRQVDLFQLYTDTEIIIIDSDGGVRLDKMADFGLTGSNPLGEIPQIYLNKSQHELVPFPDTCDLDISIVVPKLLADLNYAAQFLSHSMIWTKNADLGNQEANPDTIIDLGDSDQSAGKGEPEIGTISPQVDIAGVLSLIEFQTSGYFSSKGIKTAGMKDVLPGREASGIAKAMDEGDTSAELKVQTEYFRSIENALWTKYMKIQDYYSSNNLVDDKRKFSDSFADNTSIIFREMKVIESSQEKVMRIQAQKDLGIIDRRSMIKEFNPDFSEEQIEDRLAAADKDKQEMMQSMLDMGGQIGDQATEAPDQSSGQPKSGSENSGSN